MSSSASPCKPPPRQWSRKHHKEFKDVIIKGMTDSGQSKSSAEAKYTQIQASVQEATRKYFHEDKTARKQPLEVLESIKIDVRSSHGAILDRYEGLWPVEVLMKQYIENYQSNVNKKANKREARDEIDVETRKRPRSRSTPPGGPLPYLDRIGSITRDRDRPESSPTSQINSQPAVTSHNAYISDQNFQGPDDNTIIPLSEVFYPQASNVPVPSNSIAHEQYPSFSQTTYVLNHGSALDDELKNVVRRDMYSRVNDIETRVNNIDTRLLLEKLGALDAAGIDAQSPEGCTEGTCTETLNALREWSGNIESSRFYWLHGKAGIGKSAISRSFCRYLQEKGALGGSFFCSRERTVDQRDIKRVVPTLAMALSLCDDVYKRVLLNVLKERIVSSSSNIDVQLEYLLKRPLQDAFLHVPQRHTPLVLVIDDLDECEDEEDVKRFLKRLPTTLPPAVKVFIASRNERHVRNQLARYDPGPRIFRLENLSNDSIREDITRYLKIQLEEIRQEALFISQPEWPSDRAIRILADQAQNTFIHASALVQYIARDPRARLQRLLRDGIIDDFTGLYLRRRYSYILSRTIRESVSDMTSLKRILAVVVALRAPLPLSALEELIGMPSSQLRLVLGSLRGVVCMRADDDCIVSVPHPSFGQFLATSWRFPDEKTITPSDGHRDMSVQCCRIMRSELHFNMSRCKTSYLSNDRQDLLEIPAHVEYACLHWSYHLVAASSSSIPSLLADFIDVLKSKFLFWLEVLSVTNNMYDAALILAKAFGIDNLIQSVPSAAALLLDGIKFIRSSEESMASNVTHIYLSALPLTRSTSDIARLFWPLLAHTPQITTYGVTRQSCTVHVFEGYETTLITVALSPDGTRIAAGWDMEIWIWDAQTGELTMPPLTGHTFEVTSMAFSPDGMRIASGSWGGTVWVWDAQTGEPATLPLTGHTNGIKTVSFSPDGTRIVSGSSDRTIRIWDAQTGELAIPPLTGHAGSVISVAFSPDGTRIASGSYDKTVRLWDTQTGKLTMSPLEGHTACIKSVTFSHDGTQIVSCWDDCAIRIWDARTGELVAIPLTLARHYNGDIKCMSFSPDGTQVALGLGNDYGDDEVACDVLVGDVQTGELVLSPLVGHVGSVISVTFSPDGTWLASCSHDGTIRVWDIRKTDDLAIVPHTGHTGCVSSVAFSPNGMRIASISKNGTIRVWDTQTGDLAIPILEGGPRYMSSVSFSPDGAWIASNRDEDTIGVWDAQTGELTMELLVNHPVCVAFSPDGNQLASGLADGTIRVYDTQTRELAVPPLTGHLYRVASVAFSPDGTRIVSGSQDETLRIWDTQTGELAMPPLVGHTDWVRPVAFSLDGTRIVSCSDDKTIRVWDAQTGELAMPPFTGYADDIDSAAFSPDGTRIVSGSADETIRVWDAQTGELAMAPLKGHTDWVWAVAFSPDGTQIVSGSLDGVVCTHDLKQIGVSSATARLQDQCMLIMGGRYSKPENEGWIVDPQDRPLLWVPPEFRAYVDIDSPRRGRALGGRVTIDFSDFVHGTDWTKCFNPNASLSDPTSPSPSS